jgi:GDP-4-dehydro-6-deoxy-D-mannose reductase
VLTHEVDLLDRSRTASVLEAVKPDWVFHLAAMSSPAASWQDPAGTITTNATLQAHLMSSLIAMAPMPRVLIVGSGDEYGRPGGRARRLNEETPLRPITPYGVSKVTQDLLGLQYFLSHGLPVVRVRPFNHAGPRQSPQFAVASFARQIAQIEAGKQAPVLKVGNLETRRDFTDVRDVVRAYVLVMQKGEAGEVYNIGSGTAHKLGDIVARFLKMSRAKISLEVDESRKRTAEADVYLCDASRLEHLTGWHPQISFERTLRDTLQYWRESERIAA